MVAFVYQCPTTSLRVRGWVADDPSERDEKSYEAVTCTICARIHLVNPRTGKVLFAEGDRCISATDSRGDNLAHFGNGMRRGCVRAAMRRSNPKSERRDYKERERLRAATASARRAVMQAYVALAEAIELLEVAKKIEQPLIGLQTE